ncbi:M1 family metallopeptidase [Yinghuangia sp. ASG 101]|uniref:M1 family metallopeptidase n=1 Tax=Yinghuangia sp. ASG 101 TaxID=2896848 RepID=UPI001E2D8BB9|nr:M1 family metallopeptidase [Yinghuangia sp. ASG 101]UGQ13007.1 M1 family metallopeptidase [Yinghuangia sp. ASG 101]
MTSAHETPDPTTPPTPRSLTGTRPPTRTRRRAAAVAGLACALTLTAALPVEAAARGGAIPASGAGDPYFPFAGNQGYDVEHYDLDLDFASPVLTAQATLTARATADLNEFHLDYSGPAIEEVEVSGRPADHRREGQELIITPSAPIPAGHVFTVRVRYRGTPETVDDPQLGAHGWIITDDGAVTLNQPDGARSWYPVNDDVRDKATYTFHITTAADMTALANGEPTGPPRVSGDRSTATWVMREPMASYLSMVAIGDFTRTDGTVGGLPHITAYDPAGQETDGELRTVTAEAVQWGQERFGAYPFDSTGGIIDRVGGGYALETQSRPVYDGAPDEATIVHEIAHQWFGDSVTPKTWADIWLNEGFATYAEWLWGESRGGPSAQSVFDEYYATPADDPFWSRKTGDPGREHMFDYQTVYLRGAMALHALRTRIGDADFSALLRAWAEKHRHGNADTGDLLALTRSVAGLSEADAAQWADTWLYTAAKPAEPAAR